MFYEQKLSPTASSLKNETNNHSCHSVYIFFLYYTKKQKKVNPIFQSFLKNGNHKKAVSDRIMTIAKALAGNDPPRLKLSN
ncbi:MAG: hypothetical protein BHW52_04760 [Ruminococcus sp. 37_24]|nr:MAG: hypothetical protein BHW52_04760 [Ruminococcus sp. 37_24]